MRIENQAIAGTLESSDIQLVIRPNDHEENQLILQSSVEKQYGRRIREVIMQTLNHLSVTNATIEAVDNGALDCTIIARTMAAVHRAQGISENYNWEGFETWNG